MRCATVGPRGWPHLMALWYVLRGSPAGDAPASGSVRGEPPRDPAPEPGPRIWSWTYAASQKVRNLERDPRATLLFDTGEAYEELRGVMFECDVIVHRDIDTVAPLGGEILLRNSLARGVEPPSQLPSEVHAMIETQAAKRVGLEFVERRRASWDHRKLAGVY
jgi:Pyridoxamine 5'-phosphate oxidase